MRSKEILLVVVGALLLTNVSIFGTLVASGHFGDDAESSDPEEAVAATEDAPAPAVEPPAPEPKNVLHSMADAMYLCRDKVQQSSSSERKSYSFDYNASFYDEQERIYHVFIEYQKVGDFNNPGQLSDIICDVSAVEGTIVNYKVMGK